MNFLLATTFTPPSFVIAFLKFLQAPSPKPKPYGVYHLSVLVLAAVLTLFLCAFFRDAAERTMRRIVTWVWILLVVLELYKQLVSCAYISGEEVTLAYAWGAFPFQLCSMPLYVLPLVAFLPDGALRRALMAFSSTFALFGGLVVLINPSTVFCGSLGMNIQTMAHHVLQMSVGVYIGVFARYDLGWRQFWHGTGVFLVLLSVAVYLNEVVHGYLLHIGSTTHFNMFFVSPYYPGPIGFINEWHGNMPPMLFVLLYAVGLTLAAALIFWIVRTSAIAYDKKRRNTI